MWNFYSSLMSLLGSLAGNLHLLLSAERSSKGVITISVQYVTNFKNTSIFSDFCRAAKFLHTASVLFGESLIETRMWRKTSTQTLTPLCIELHLLEERKGSQNPPKTHTHTSETEVK